MSEIASVFFSGVALGAAFGGLIAAAIAWDKAFYLGVNYCQTVLNTPPMRAPEGHVEAEVAHA